VERPGFNDGQYNLLGLGFWSRFVVTLDFAGQRAYLREGKGYGRSDLRWNLSGLRLVRQDSSVIVRQVEADSPGAAAGVRPGDVLLKFEGNSVEKASLFELRNALAAEGTLHCVVRRGPREHRMTLVLRDPVRTMPALPTTTPPAPSVVPTGVRR
jgi:S1-C subfamily serine protease